MRASLGRLPFGQAWFLAIAAAISGCAGSSAPPSVTPVPNDDRAPQTRTSSDSRVEHEESHQSYSRIEEIIEGHASGVRVIRSQDGSVRLQIRGVSSPSGRNEPIVVIDGIPASGRSGSALTSVNPQDVVRVEVLKDAASTAFYGMRGANGVIVITTRQH